jgi:aryl-alcohol dehydrogenase-like predicted oxidoreductase
MGSDLLFTWAPLGIRPAQILRGIASGVLGPKSFYGGWPTAMLGATLHFLIAFSAASVFYGASRKPIFLTQRPVLSGALYGIVVYLFMYWVVLPLSAYHKSPFSIILTARLDDRWWPSERTLMSTPLTRQLGADEIPAIGMGCWAIGGPFWFGTQPLGWGEVDDNESIAAIHKALDLGVSFFDTANIYGCGHSERVLGTALKGVREQVIIATKFGNTFDESTRQKTGQDASPEGIRRACDESLQRLGATYIDLYQFHLNDYDPEKAV